MTEWLALDSVSATSVVRQQPGILALPKTVICVRLLMIFKEKTCHLSLQQDNNKLNFFKIVSFLEQAGSCAS